VESNDGLPYIGPLAYRSHVHIAVGYAGAGMMFGTLAGMILADAIAARPNPFAELYTASRLHRLASSAVHAIAESEEERPEDHRPRTF
jgi:glycine/D-amino acid oxidase-like deaminating enzyme